MGKNVSTLRRASSRRDRFIHAVQRLRAVWHHTGINAVNFWRHAIRCQDLLKPIYAIWELTYACNLRCSYCDDGTGRSYPPQARVRSPLPHKDALHLLTMIRKEVPAILFCGGEPTIHPHFLSLLREASKLGFRPIMLNTNGLHLERLFVEDNNLFDMLDIIIFSLDSMRPEVLDELYCSKRGTGQRVLDAIMFCTNVARLHRCSVFVNCVVTTDTIDDVWEVAAFCRKCDIAFAPVAANCGMGRKDNFHEMTNYNQLVDKLFDDSCLRFPSTPKIYEVLMRFLPFECHPSLRIHITPDGFLPWPCQSAMLFDLCVLDYPSIGSLMDAADRRYPIYKHGLKCGSPCYLAQNVSTHYYCQQPLATIFHTARDFVFRGRG